MSDSIARAARRRLRVRRVRRAAAWALAATALGAAADAARLVHVRVGRHPDFVRVVFETDAPAAFAVEAGGEPGERRVRIEAGSAPGAVAVPPGTGAEVTLEPLPGGDTLARIRAAAPVRIESQVLDRPPRIVLDLRPGADEAVTAAGEPEPAGAPPVLAPEVAEPPILTDLAPPALTEVPPAAELLPAPAELPPAAEARAPPVEEAEEVEELERAPAEVPPAAELPPAPVQAPPVAPPPPEPQRPLEPEPPLAAEPPAVSAPPPAAIVPRLDERSLVLGAAGGLALGLGVALLARSRRARAPEDAREPTLPPLAVPVLVEDAPAPPPVEEIASDAAAPAGADRPDRPPLRMGPWPESEPLATDLLAMLQRLDDRFAAVEHALVTLGERTERLERRSEGGTEELRAQRVALARLDLALGRPLARSGAAHPPEAPAAPPARPRPG
ncbi:MAG TPA: hypothetical protein VLC53_11485 [Myxococcota bacterium]|nr:hypothetical protein [Myxococcota bacterium]